MNTRKERKRKRQSKRKKKKKKGKLGRKQKELSNFATLRCRTTHRNMVTVITRYQARCGMFQDVLDIMQNKREKREEV